MSPETGSLLKGVSTATLTVQLLKRGITNCYLRGVMPLDDYDERMVGPAYTLRYVPLREDRDPAGKLGDTDNVARNAIDHCPTGAVLVCDARGEDQCGTLGDILALRLRVRGVAGFVSDGGVRDAGAIMEVALPVFAAGPAAPASPSMHIPADVQVPIACGGVAIWPGDVMVGDGDGVVVIPAELVDEVALAGSEQEDIETFISRLVAQGRPVIGTYPPTDEVRALYREWVDAGRPR